MLSEIKSVSYANFENEFTKRFTSFSHKAPILISFTTTPYGVNIYEEKDWDHPNEGNLIYSYEFNFNKSVKENIKDIKDYLLENIYPIIYEFVTCEEDYTAEELNELVSSGDINFDDVDSAKKIKEETIPWRIEKIIIVRDEIFIRNLESNRCFRYKMRMPVTIFLKKMREDKNSDKIFDLFLRKSIMLNEIYDDFSPDKLLEKE